MEKQFTTFYLGNAIFGIDILLMREINRHLDITPVKQAPEHVRGLLNLRGQIVTILDLGVKLSLAPRVIGTASRCLVLKTNAELQDKGNLQDSTSPDVVGLLVDRVGEMVSVDEKGILPPPSNVGGVDRKYLNGIVQLEQELMATLNLRQILEEDE